jgi:hypothetical protein
MLLGAKGGVPPDLLKVFTAMAENQELMATLNDPKVLKLLRDPANQAHLAKMLREAADEPEPEGQTNAS